MDDIMLEAFRSGVGEIRISGISVLRQYAPEETVVLVASTKAYEDIVRQLEEQGFGGSYAILAMEANRRKKQDVKERMETEPQDFLSRRRAYIEECFEEPITEN